MSINNIDIDILDSIPNSFILGSTIAEQNMAGVATEYANQSLILFHSSIECVTQSLIPLSTGC